MSEHLTIEAMVTVSSALDWDVDEGVHHLQTCDDCREQLEILRLARASFMEAERVDPVVLQQIQDAVMSAAVADRKRSAVRSRVLQIGEGVLAGITALIVVMSSHIDIGSVGVAAIGFGLAAFMMLAGERLARTVPFLGTDRHA